jgi:hypothetical protein
MMYARHGSKRLRLLAPIPIPILKADELLSILSRLDVASDRLNLCMCDKYMYGLLWDPDYETCMHLIQKMLALDGEGAVNNKDIHEYVLLSSSNGKEYLDTIHRIRNIPQRRLSLTEIIRGDDISLFNFEAYRPEALASEIERDRFTLAGQLAFSTPEMYDALNEDPRFSNVTKHVMYIAIGCIRNYKLNKDKSDRMFRHVISRIGGLQSFLDKINPDTMTLCSLTTISRLIDLHVEAIDNDDVGISRELRNILFLCAAEAVFIYKTHETMTLIRYMLALGWHKT